MLFSRGIVARIVFVVMLALTSAGLLGVKPRPSSPPVPPTTNPAPAIPEPAAFVVFALGAGAVGLALHRRSRRS